MTDCAPTESEPLVEDVDDIDAAIAAEAAAKAVRAATVQTPGSRAKLLVEEQTEFQTTWLAPFRAHCDDLFPDFAARVADGRLRVTPLMMRQLLDELRTCLGPILLSQPRFVVTDMGKFDLTTWAATLTKREVTYDEFIAPGAQMTLTERKRKKKNSKMKNVTTVRDITQEERDVAWVTAKWINNDWVLAPVMGYLLRCIVPEAECAEVPTPQPPVLQHVDAVTKEVHRHNIFHHQKMVVVRLPLDCFAVSQGKANELPPGALDKCLVVDAISGNSAAVDKTDTILHDMDLALFLMWRNARRIPKGLEAFTDLLKFSADVFARLCAMQKGGTDPIAEETEETPIID
jgi:hypothetical protein